MSEWNFNMDEAPQSCYEDREVKSGKGTAIKEVFVPVKIIAASKCDKVNISYYLPKENRWCMYAKNELPIAWQIYPDHPNEEAA